VTREPAEKKTPRNEVPGLRKKSGGGPESDFMPTPSGNPPAEKKEERGENLGPEGKRKSR